MIINKEKINCVGEIKREVKCMEEIKSHPYILTFL